MGGNLVEMLGALKPAAAMVLVQFMAAGNIIFYQVALRDGMHPSILVVYRHMVAAVFFAPLAFFLERNTRPSMTWKIFLQTFFCGLFGGTLPRNLFMVAIQLTPATFATAITNVLPAMTFIVAILIRLEKIKIQTIASQAKVIGTIVAISGAMLITFYEGPKFDLWPNNFHLLKGQNDGFHHKVVNHKAGSHILGSMLAIACTLCTAIWLIIQALMSEEYPCPYSMTVLMCFMASVQSMVYAICLERDWSQWKIKFDIRLLSILYIGVVGSGLNFSLQAWCINKKGPLYAVIFCPMTLVIVALLSALLFNEKLYLGCILGAVLIVAGLYIVLFGKGRETTAVRQLSAQSKTGSSLAPGVTAEICDDPTSQIVSRSAV